MEGGIGTEIEGGIGTEKGVAKLKLKYCMRKSGL